MGCAGSKPGVAPNMGVVPGSGSKKHIPEVMSLDGPVSAPPSAPYKQKPNSVPDTPISALPPYTKLDLEIQQRFLGLPQKGKVQAEYVWIGGNNELRCKTKTLSKAPSSPADLPVWNFDGSSTEQAPGSDSEVLLVPCAIYKDPFRTGGSSKNILVRGRRGFERRAAVMR